MNHQSQYASADIHVCGFRLLHHSLLIRRFSASIKLDMLVTSRLLESDLQMPVIQTDYSCSSKPLSKPVAWLVNCSGLIWMSFIENWEVTSCCHSWLHMKVALEDFLNLYARDQLLFMIYPPCTYPRISTDVECLWTFNTRRCSLHGTLDTHYVLTETHKY